MFAKIAVLGSHISVPENYSKPLFLFTEKTIYKINPTQIIKKTTRGGRGSEISDFERT